MRKQHQGAYDAAHPAAWELSRFWVDKLIKCEACFWLQKVANVKRAEHSKFQYQLQHRYFA